MHFLPPSPFIVSTVAFLSVVYSCFFLFFCVFPVLKPFVFFFCKFSSNLVNSILVSSFHSFPSVFFSVFVALMLLLLCFFVFLVFAQPFRFLFLFFVFPFSVFCFRRILLLTGTFFDRACFSSYLFTISLPPLFFPLGLLVSQPFLF